MNNIPRPNIAVKANVWCNPKEEDNANPMPPYFLEAKIPGDLYIDFFCELDPQVLRYRLTDDQYREYLQSRFFQREGQEGYAFKK